MLQIDLFGGAIAPPVSARRRAAVKPPASIAPKAQYRGYVSDLAEMAAAWSDLHVWVLVRNLRLLASVHTEPEEREDILRWLDASAVERPAAFSAQACLSLYDPRIELADFREAVGRANRRVLDGRLEAPASARPH